MTENTFICEVCKEEVSLHDGTGFGQCAPCGDGLIHKAEKDAGRRLRPKEDMMVLLGKFKG